MEEKGDETLRRQIEEIMFEEDNDESERSAAEERIEVNEESSEGSDDEEQKSSAAGSKESDAILDEDTKMIRAEKANSVAMAWYMQAFAGNERLLSFVASAAGEACVLTSDLMKKYYAESIFAMGDLIDEVFALEFEERDDPSHFIRKVARLELEHGVKMPEECKAAALVKKLPPAYATIVTTCVKAKKTKISDMEPKPRLTSQVLLYGKDGKKGLGKDDDDAKQIDDVNKKDDDKEEETQKDDDNTMNDDNDEDNKNDGAGKGSKRMIKGPWHNCYDEGYRKFECPIWTEERCQSNLFALVETRTQGGELLGD